MIAQAENLKFSGTDSDLTIARTAINNLLEEIEVLEVCLKNIANVCAKERASVNSIYGLIKFFLPRTLLNRRKAYKAFQASNCRVRLLNSMLNNLTENLNEQGHRLELIVLTEKNYKNPATGDIMQVPDLLSLKQAGAAYKRQIEPLYVRATSAKNRSEGGPIARKKAPRDRHPKVPPQAGYFRG